MLVDVEELLRCQCLAGEPIDENWHRGVLENSEVWSTQDCVIHSVKVMCNILQLSIDQSDGRPDVILFVL